MSGAVLELLLADARTPTGGYAHSGGLEAAVEAGLRACDVPGFMRARLLTVGRVDAAFASLGCGAESVEALLVLDLEYAARTPAEPLRRAARQLGRGLLRTAAVWFPEAELLADYRSASALTPRPVALGAIARVGGLSCVAAARASLYDDAATVAAAAVKLLPLDAAVASSWVLSLGREIDAIADACTAPAAPIVPSGPSGPGKTTPFSSATPLLDRRALDHANTERRLFVS